MLLIVAGGERGKCSIFLALAAVSLACHNFRMPESTWTEKADALIRVTHPDFAARKLRLPLESILARRKELQLPPVDEQFPK
jgi:hypothetical protein